MNDVRVAIVDHVGMKAGMDIYDENLARALINRNFPTVVYSNFQRKNLEDFIEHAFPFTEETTAGSVFNLLKYYQLVRKDIEKQKISHCILHAFRFGILEWLMLRQIKKANVKVCLVIHDMESLIGINQSARLRTRIFSMADKLVVHNQYCYIELLKLTNGYEANKTFVIPHGNFVSAATSAASSGENIDFWSVPGKKYLLFFGHIKETKGLDILLDAMQHIDPSIDLIIAGRIRGESFERYREIIARNNLGKRVHCYIGYIASEERDFLFQKADVIVIPYRKVYQSGVMLMGMSFGKAVIASDLQPTREVIHHGGNGILFESGNVDALAGAVNDLMNNEDERSRLARNGFEYVKEKHSWSDIASRWIQIISE